MGIIGLSKLMSVRGALGTLKMSGAELGKKVARMYGSTDGLNVLRAVQSDEVGKRVPDKNFIGILEQACQAVAEADVSATIENRAKKI